ncbi:MAG: TIGR03067 domain-containing protein [Acidobacteria bacterium]|nr:TIGR03067 domain-containing protein [Acidobacteriota bacterium]
MKKIQLTIDAGGKAHARREGTVFIAAATEIDPDKNPMTIDMAYTEGDPKGRTALGIYKIEDDVLTICRAAPGKARPSEFSSQPGSGHTLMTYRREKSR